MVSEETAERESFESLPDETEEEHRPDEESVMTSFETQSSAGNRSYEEGGEELIVRSSV